MENEKQNTEPTKIMHKHKCESKRKISGNLCTNNDRIGVVGVYASFFLVWRLLPIYPIRCLCLCAFYNVSKCDEDVTYWYLYGRMKIFLGCNCDGNRLCRIIQWPTVCLPLRCHLFHRTLLFCLEYWCASNCFITVGIRPNAKDNNTYCDFYQNKRCHMIGNWILLMRMKAAI